MAVAVSACFAVGEAVALPTAPQVAAGTATFSQTANVLTVTNSAGAVINWNSFSIGAGETTRFIQPSASSSVLNRVLAHDPSVIYGTLSSNGKVWLINPAGIMVGAGGKIDVAGFVASTLNISNENFLAGRMQFDATAGAASVVNKGSITAPSGGTVYLVAPNVTNEGIINASNGEVILAAGQTVNLIDTGTPGVKVEITGAEGNVTNLGEVLSQAGRIGMAGVIVRNSGTLNASSVVEEGGRIFLKASQDAYVDGAGRIVTTGTKGGRVEVLGNRVAVMDQASIDASGTNGGGTVLVGGDYQGKNPDIQNAQITYFGPQATIKADATDNGNGGKVILWADDTTRAYGKIYARGGANGGNGGFVETSGYRYLDFRASVDTRAPKGKTGTLLLDPANIWINDTGAPVNLTGVFTPAANNTDSTIGWDQIVTQLGTSAVNITTMTYGGSIYLNQVSGPWTYNSANSLTFQSYNDINLSYNGNATTIVNSGAGNISFWAGGDIYGNWYAGPNLPPSVGVNITTGGQINFYAQGAGHQGAGIHLGNGTITSSYGGGTAISLTSTEGSIGIGQLRATGSGSVSVSAKYSIWDENWTTPGATNIYTNGGSISLTSSYGGDPYSTCSSGYCSAISVDTAGTPSGIYATVSSNATSGGIDIRHQGNAPADTDLSDYSTNPYNNWVEFFATGDMTVGASNYFYSNGGDIYIGAGGNLTVSNGGAFSGTPSEIGLYAGNTLTINSAISVTNTSGAWYPFLGLMAGSTINVNANISSAGDIGISAGIGKNTYDALDDYPTPEEFSNYLASTGSIVNINATVSASDSVGLLGHSINLNNGGGQVLAGYDIFGYTSGDITLTNGAKMQAGYGVFLEMAGAGSTLYLNKVSGLSPSEIKSDNWYIDVDFPARSSGGIVIDGVQTNQTVAGGSGFYVGGAPASLGTGLFVTYGVMENNPVTNEITTSMANATSATQISSTANTQDMALAGTTTTSTGTVVTTAPATTTGGTEGTFGGDAGAGTTTTSGESSGGTANGEAKEEKKEEKKSEKDTDKGKKDDKPAAKKVAQCT